MSYGEQRTMTAERRAGVQYVSCQCYSLVFLSVCKCEEYAIDSTISMVAKPYKCAETQ